METAANLTEATAPRRLNVFDRYMPLWVTLCILAGIVIGRVIPGLVGALSRMEVSHVNLPIAVLIWLMVYPTMLRIDFTSLRGVRRHPRGILLTLSRFTSTRVWRTGWPGGSASRTRSLLPQP